MRLERRKHEMRVPIASMSDVSFLLLIFIMLVALMNYRPEVGVDRAEARAVVNTTAERNLEIWIDRNGALFLDGYASSLAAVQDAIDVLHLGAWDSRIHVIADRNTAYKHVSAVLETLQLLEYRTVSLVVRNIE